MKLAVLALVVMAACQSGSGDDDDYPIGPGGGGPIAGGGGGMDAGTGDGGDSGTITRRVCVLKDVRLIGTAAGCETDGADGLNVSLDGKTAKTGRDGTFVIDRPVSSSAVWRVDSGTAVRLVPSLTPYSADLLIPAITVDRYLDMQSGSSVVLGADEGSIFVRIVKGTGAPSGITAISNPIANHDPRYDSGNIDIWSTTQTDRAGIVWIPGVPVLNGTSVRATVSLRPVGSTTSTTVDATVADQAVTFVTRSLP